MSQAILFRQQDLHAYIYTTQAAGHIACSHAIHGYSWFGTGLVPAYVAGIRICMYLGGMYVWLGSSWPIAGDI